VSKPDRQTAEAVAKTKHESFAIDACVYGFEGANTSENLNISIL
jgi:hypothetical protein